jgi:hypothetical protein
MMSSIFASLCLTSLNGKISRINVKIFLDLSLSSKKAIKTKDIRKMRRKIPTEGS